MSLLVKRRSAMWLIAVLLASQAPCIAAESYELQLGEVHLLSNERYDHTAEVARSIDLHHEAFAKFMQIPQVKIGIPITVLVLSEPTWKKYVTSVSGINGVFYPSETHAYALLNGTSWLGGSWVVNYQLTHLYLQKSRSSQAVPLWLITGYAVFFTTVDVEREKLRVGLVPEWRWKAMKSLGRIPVKDVLTLSATDAKKISQDRWQAFSAQSWLLIHYWQFGDPKWIGKLNGFVARLNNGATATEALELEFGAEIDDFDRAMLNYERQTKYRHNYFELREFPDARAYQSKLLARSEEDFVAAMSDWILSLETITDEQLGLLRIAANAPQSSAVAKLRFAVAEAHGTNPAAADQSFQSNCLSLSLGYRELSLCSRLRYEQAKSARSDLSDAERAQRFNESARLAMSAVTLDQSSLAVLVEAAAVVKAAGVDRTQIITALESALTKDPTSAIAAYTLSELCLPVDSVKAITYAEQAIKHDFRSERAAATRAWLENAKTSHE